MDDNLKEILMAELENKGLDYVLFHAHGDTDMQLLLSYPKADKYHYECGRDKTVFAEQIKNCTKKKSIS
jgi:hypothetical protein